jgi:hypothetical protein
MGNEIGKRPPPGSSAGSVGQTTSKPPKRPPDQPGKPAVDPKPKGWKAGPPKQRPPAAPSAPPTPGKGEKAPGDAGPVRPGTAAQPKGDYTVVPGDTMWSIAKRLTQERAQGPTNDTSVSRTLDELKALNQHLFSEKRNQGGRIFPGDQVTYPKTPAAAPASQASPPAAPAGAPPAAPAAPEAPTASAPGASTPPTAAAREALELMGAPATYGTQAPAGPAPANAPPTKGLGGAAFTEDLALRRGLAQQERQFQEMTAKMGIEEKLGASLQALDAKLLPNPADDSPLADAGAPTPRSTIAESLAAFEEAPAEASPQAAAAAQPGAVSLGDRPEDVLQRKLPAAPEVPVTADVLRQATTVQPAKGEPDPVALAELFDRLSRFAANTKGSSLTPAQTDMLKRSLDDLRQQAPQYLQRPEIADLVNRFAADT